MGVVLKSYFCVFRFRMANHKCRCRHVELPHCSSSELIAICHWILIYNSWTSNWDLNNNKKKKKYFIITNEHALWERWQREKAALTLGSSVPCSRVPQQCSLKVSWHKHTCPMLVCNQGLNREPSTTQPSPLQTELPLPGWWLQFGTHTQPN